MIDEDLIDEEGNEIEPEIKELQENHDLDRDTAEEVQEIMDEYGVDEDDAIEIQESL